MGNTSIVARGSATRKPPACGNAPDSHAATPMTRAKSATFTTTAISTPPLPRTRHRQRGASAEAAGELPTLGSETKPDRGGEADRPADAQEAVGPSPLRVRRAGIGRVQHFAEGPLGERPRTEPEEG